MAFQDISSPARVLNRELTLTRLWLSKIGSFFSGIGNSLLRAMIARRRIELVAALQAKSDEELARLNIKREEIVRHVFMDVYYT